MSNNKVQVKNTGIGFFGLLTIVLITLKLCNVISWSWFWVLFPLFIPLTIFIGFLAFIAFCFVLSEIIKK